MSNAIRSEVFLREDIQSVLIAIDGANRQMAQWAPSDAVDVYRSGFRAALESVATALHVDLQTHQNRPPITPEILDLRSLSLHGLSIEHGLLPMRSQG